MPHGVVFVADDFDSSLAGEENGYAIGYMIMAAQEVGLDKHLVGLIEDEMHRKMDIFTETQAEQVYRSF